ncbi:ABC transporter ATP-binding protein [Bacillus sp. NPDC077027]|uniref:ABC transporter ATP-binding protein n=1 Tax=Bacillus sp. NPDC077027 TaxID=3390548 RepID=UPI003D08A0E3
MGKVLELNNVSKTIRGKKIVQDLSFSVQAGEVFGFLGPNGAGKTTTIRMMVGLSPITSGDILIKGHSIQSSYQHAIRDVGAIIENPEMYNHLTARQNLVHFARMNGKVDEERIDELLQLVSLQHVKNKRVRTFSLGMKQRLGIAQALIHKPKLLILDEPTNGLDPEGIRMIRDYLRELAKEEGLAVIVSSHLMSEMELMCDRFAIIQSGKLIAIEDQRVTEKVNALTNYRLKVSHEQLEVTKQLIEAFEDGIHVREEGEYLLFALQEANMPKLIRHLSHESVDIYEVKVEKQTLEDKFLSLTGKKEATV